jgi:hypothetical protein
MADNTTPQTAQNATPEALKKPSESESHLSPTALFVLPFLQKITTRMRDKKLVEQANGLIGKLMKGEIIAEDPTVIDFILACGQEKDAIIEELTKANAGTKAEAVIRNFFAKFLDKEIKQKPPKTATA